MTQTWDCTEARPSLGVYVLGAIDPGERALVDAHLTTCRDCRDELAGLAGLPALLALRAATSSTHTVYAAQYPAGTGRWETAKTTSKVSGTSATIKYAPEYWGNAFEVLVSGIAVGTTCELWVIHPDGSRTEVAAWTVAHDEGRVWYPGSMPDSSKAISSFEITAGNKVLVTATAT